MFDSVQLMYYKCPRVNFRCGGPYIDSPNLIKKKKTAINSKQKDAGTVSLNYEDIK